jgi:hypothetical protein
MRFAMTDFSFPDRSSGRRAALALQPAGSACIQTASANRKDA